MIEFILTLIIGSFWCFGIYVFVKEVVYKQILAMDLDEEWDRIPYWLQMVKKPLYACPYCMASVHGTLVFWACLAGHCPIIIWVPFMICLCGLNFIIKNLIFKE